MLKGHNFKRNVFLSLNIVFSYLTDHGSHHLRHNVKKSFHIGLDVKPSFKTYVYSKTGVKRPLKIKIKQRYL